MSTSKDADVSSAPLSHDIVNFIRARIGGRRALLLVAAGGVAAVLALNWSWLVATGIAPVLVAVLPCLVMCGVGLCMNKMTGASCDAPSAAAGDKPSAAVMKMPPHRPAAAGAAKAAGRARAGRKRKRAARTRNSQNHERRTTHA